MAISKIGNFCFAVSFSLLSGCMSLDERLASSNPRIRANAEVELIRESRTTGSREKRLDAINRISGESLLSSIAISSTGEYVPDGIVATKRLLNNDLELLKIAKQAESDEVREIAVEKLIGLGNVSEQEFVEIAKTANSTKVKALAVKRIERMQTIDSIIDDYWLLAKDKDVALLNCLIVRYGVIMRRSGRANYVESGIRSALNNLSPADRKMSCSYFVRAVSDSKSLSEFYDEYSDFFSASMCEKVYTITKRKDVMERSKFLSRHEKRKNSNSEYAKAANVTERCIDTFSREVTPFGCENRRTILKQMSSIKDEELLFLFLSSKVLFEYGDSAVNDEYRRGLVTLLTKIKAPEMFQVLKQRGAFTGYQGNKIVKQMEEEWLHEQI